MIGQKQLNILMRNKSGNNDHRWVSTPNGNNDSRERDRGRGDTEETIQ